MNISQVSPQGSTTDSSFGTTVEATSVNAEAKKNSTEFMECIQKLIVNSDINYKITNIHLSAFEINIIKIIIKNNPHIFSEIYNNIIEIIYNNTIELHNIPLFIQQIKDLYLCCNNDKSITLDETILPEIVASIMKYLIRVMIYRNDMYSDYLYTCCTNIIDISIQMIILQLVLHPKSPKFCICG
jgi:hypothetical protein